MQLNRLFLLLVFLPACSSPDKTPEPYATDHLKIDALSKNVMMHVSYLVTNDFGKVDCNGMVYFNGDEAIVFDTPTNDQATAELIDWIQVKQGKKIKAVVVTHFHDDCLGGLKQFHASGITSYSNYKTIELAKQANVTELPATGFSSAIEFNVGHESVTATFYGAGHTADNIVGYIPAERTLFGGCLIKSMDASKGYLGDANTIAWPLTVDSIRKHLPDLKMVIPGHGNPGGKELLDYTIDLFQKK